MKTTTFAGIAGFVLLFNGTAWSQQRPTATEDLVTRGRQALELGIEALGGRARMAALDDIGYHSDATLPEIGQSAGPDAAYYPRPETTDGVLDFRHQRTWQQRTTHYIGSGPRITSAITTEHAGFAVDLKSGVAYPAATAFVAAGNRNSLRFFPHLLLLSLAEHPLSLRLLGTRTVEGRTANLVDALEADGRRWTLLFDARTGVLIGTERLIDSFLHGMCAAENGFSDYRDVEGVSIPFHVIARTCGEVTADVRYTDIHANTHPADSLFVPPRGVEIDSTTPGSVQNITLTSLGRGIYYVNAIGTGSVFFYSSLIVEFRDFLLVLETPLSDAVSRAIIAKTRETIPGKPIRYAVLTHYHTDHSGGVRAYLTEGATLITTPGNLRFFDHLARLDHSFGRDVMMPSDSVRIAIDTFSERRVISDGEQSVELYQIGPTAHANEMVIAYLPSARLLFVSDLFLVPYRGQLGAADPVTVDFAARLDRLGLQVDRIASGHGRIGTLADLRQSLELAHAEVPPGLRR